MDTKQINKYCLSLKKYLDKNYKEVKIEYLLENDEDLFLKIEMINYDRITNLVKDLKILIRTRNTIFDDINIIIYTQNGNDKCIFKIIYGIVLHIRKENINADKKLIMTYNYETERIYMCKVYNIIEKIYNKEIANIIINYL